MKYLKTCLLAFFNVLTAAVYAQDTLPRQGRNIVYLHAAYFHNEVLHDCFGVGAGFEKMLDKKEIIAVTVPVTIGIPGSDNRIGFLKVEGAHQFHFSFSAVPGFKFYAGKKSAKARYAIGASVFFEAGRQNTYAFGEPANLDKPVEKYSVFGYMLTNSLQARLSRHYNVGLTVGTGMAAKRHKGSGYSFNWYNGYGPGFLGWIMLSAGYRL